MLLYTRLKELSGEEDDDDRGGRGEQLKPIKTFSDVVVGGTFDRLHGAHKTLLNISCLLANRRFVIGVCDQELLKSKWRLSRKIYKFVGGITSRVLSIVSCTGDL